MKEKGAKHEFVHDHEKHFAFFTNTNFPLAFSSKDFGNMLIGSRKNDEKEKVIKRLENFCSAVGVKEENRVLMVPHITGNMALVDKEDAKKDQVKTDALITRDPEAVLSVKSADCPPVILISEDRKALALINGGLSSIRQDIIQKTVSRVRRMTTTSFKAFIGPGICGKHYQPPLWKAVLLKYSSRWSSYVDELNFDLNGFIKDELIDLGIKDIFEAKICTYKSPYFPSHAKAVRNPNIKEERFLTLVSLR